MEIYGENNLTTNYETGGSAGYEQKWEEKNQFALVARYM